MKKNGYNTKYIYYQIGKNNDVLDEYKLTFMAGTDNPVLMGKKILIVMKSKFCLDSFRSIEY